MIYASQHHSQTVTGVRRTVVYRLPDGEQERIWWDVSGPVQNLPSAPSNDDLALTSLLFLAMNRGMALHIEGSVTRSMLERAELFMNIWSLWRPDVYQKVEVSADQELPDRLSDVNRDRLAICAFSGGVDAAFTAFSHHKRLAGRASREIRTGVLIQGFDIGLDEQKAFDVSLQSARIMLDDLGIPLVTVRTNWKADICQFWEMEFGLGVFCCLKLWEDSVGSLLVGSCEDYSRLVTPWGSHPLPTTLLAANGVDLVYDGGHLNRTQKVKLLSDWPIGYDNLRVCWQGDVTGENCGVCEKCIRTKLNAIVSGKPLPASLRGPPTPRQVARIGPMNKAQKALFSEILTEAEANGFRGPLVKAAKVALARRKPPVDVRLKTALPSSALRIGRRLKRLARSKAP